VTRSHGRARVWGSVTALLMVVVGVAWAIPRQEVWQADVRVQSLEVMSLQTAGMSTRGGRQLSTRVVIASDNDDDARAVRLEILLPIGVGVLRLAPGCQASPGAVATLTGRVTCELGNIPVRGFREVVITTTGSVSTGGRFAVFVTSETPDPMPSNNYAERLVQ
jgi:hypothetical protein